MHSVAPRRGRLARTLVAFAVAAAAVSPALLVAGPAHAAGTPLLTESFTGSSIADPAWRGLNDACLTGATTAVPAGSSNLSQCSDLSGSPAVGTPGFLQLNAESGFRRGGVVYNQAIPGNGGLVVEFDQWQYGPDGGDGGDGIGFFLTDGNEQLTMTGADGGSLGYGNRNGDPGVVGGYVGIGLDAYGNYANPTELRDSTCTPPEVGPGFVPNAVSLRGPGSGTTGYCWLAGTVGANTGGERFASTLPGSLRGTGADDTSRDSVRVTLSPDALPLVTVDIDFHDGRGYLRVLEHQMTDAAPDTYKLGFLGSTGGATDVHLIRNLAVSSVQELGALNLVKSVSGTAPAEGWAVGDRIPYTFTVSNTSIVRLDSLAIGDALADDVTCPVASLAPVGQPGATAVCAGGHTVTAADAQAATFTNTATATAVDSRNGAAIASAASTATAPLDQLQPAVGLTQTAELIDADGDGVAGPGDTIRYRFTVTNTGETPLGDLAVDTGGAPAVDTTGIVLAVGGTRTFTSDRPVTQADVDAGGPLVNTASATGSSPSGLTAASGPSVVETPLLTASDLLELGVEQALTTDADGDGLADLGDVVTYTYTVTNTGTSTLSGVALAPTRGTGVVVLSGDPASLAPGASVTYRATTTVTQADVDSPDPVTETATASATGVDGPLTSPPASVQTVTAAADDALSVDVVPVLDDTNGNGVADPGETISYSYVVTNTGNTSLTGIVIDGPGVLQPVRVGDGAAAPGGTVRFTSAPRTVTQADVDAGDPLVVTATATGTTPEGTTIDSPQASGSTPLLAARADLDLELTAVLGDANGNGTADVGETITYTYTSTNTGTVTLTGLGVTAPRTPITTASPASLAPGASGSVSGSYVVTQADIDAGTDLGATAVATATDPAGGVVTSPEAALAIPTPVTPGTGGLSIEVTAELADTNGNGVADAGEVVTYRYVVRNEGTVSLTGVSVADPDAQGLTPESVDLAPGGSATFTATRTVTARDVIAAAAGDGTVPTTARATGTAPDGTFVTSPAAAVAVEAGAVPTSPTDPSTPPVDPGTGPVVPGPAAPGPAAPGPGAGTVPGGAGGGTGTTAGRPGLAFTGSDSAWLASIATMLLVAGAGAVSVSRLRTGGGRRQRP
ncbi:hypothetical protein IFT90_09520 [Frigoribacterium sp. CFBP 8766]|uniref:DUF7507 domain-containing protein n=1 Tax=Frigoribacterium sp. CFBP 8766 TaxID=2775273 RepID=UPI0017857E73|nr:hypothetical protein [Frigoribacterium sp. CFBP 8766]MBD8584796.1 hypothetical protein [Frigoribacterium sp. CFBP 8766]